MPDFLATSNIVSPDEKDTFFPFIIIVSVDKFLFSANSIIVPHLYSVFVVFTLFVVFVVLNSTNSMNSKNTINPKGYPFDSVR